MKLAGTAPYGMRVGADGKTLEPHPEEQRCIGRALVLAEKGLPLRGIASMLSLEGFRTRRGTDLTHVQVGNMLRAAGRNGDAAAADVEGLDSDEMLPECRGPYDMTGPWCSCGRPSTYQSGWCGTPPAPPGPSLLTPDRRARLLAALSRGR